MKTIFLFDSPAKNPFVAPTQSTHIGDINTSPCYRKTCEALVKRTIVDLLLPAIMAMDKMQVATFGSLQMEPMTISHGLTKHSIRSKHTAMRILGYICHSPAHQPSSKGGFVDVSAPPRDLPPGTVVGRVSLKPILDVTWSTHHLNKMHKQIQFILEESGFLDLQRNGFHWMLHYNNKIFPIVLHPYISPIIGDSEAHDRLCGHYAARFSKIKQPCRACECPTLESGYSKAKYCHRKPTLINRLVRSGSLQGLQGMSQNCLSIGFNEVCFGLQNNRGIFGSCPGEMLHLVSLGWFKYYLEAFSAQAGGPSSLALKKYDSFCASLGKRLSRHSDRDLSRMKLLKGFLSGANLMGHEITGCLLVKLFALYATEFRRLFTPSCLKKKPTKKPNKNRRRRLWTRTWSLLMRGNFTMRITSPIGYWLCRRSSSGTSGRSNPQYEGIKWKGHSMLCNGSCARSQTRKWGTTRSKLIWCCTYVRIFWTPVFLIMWTARMLSLHIYRCWR